MFCIIKTARVIGSCRFHVNSKLSYLTQLHTAKVVVTGNRNLTFSRHLLAGHEAELLDEHVKQEGRGVENKLEESTKYVLAENLPGYYRHKDVQHIFNDVNIMGGINGIQLDGVTTTRYGKAVLCVNSLEDFQRAMDKNAHTFTRTNMDKEGMLEPQLAQPHTVVWTGVEQSVDSVRKFFEPLTIVNIQQKRQKDKFLVTFENDEDMKTALLKSGQYIGRRFVRIVEYTSDVTIAVRELTPEESKFTRSIHWTGVKMWNDRLREYFQPLEIENIKPIGAGSYIITFASDADMKQALRKNGQLIRDSFVRIAPANLAPFQGVHTISWNGVDVAVEEIHDFFQPLKIKSVLKTSRGAFSITFESEDDVNEAMSRHRQYIRDRWVNLRRANEL